MKQPRRICAPNSCQGSLRRICWEHPRAQTFWRCFGLLVYGFFTWVTFDSSYEARVVFDQIYNFPVRNAVNQVIHRIAFVGDSLCLDDAPRKELIMRLQTHHPARVWTPIDACHGGSNVSEMNTRIQFDVLRKPNVEAIFMLWDSDASDLYRYSGQGNGERTDPPSQAVHELYKYNLGKLIDSYKSVTQKIIIGGPILHGERKRGLNPMDSIYETFVEINVKIAREKNVTYVNFREIFFSTFPPGWDKVAKRKEEGGDGGWLTIDGEHENDRGHAIILDTFAQILLEKFFPGNDDETEEARQGHRLRGGQG